MNKNNQIIALVAVFLVLISSGYVLFYNRNTEPEYVIDESDYLSGEDLIENIPESELSEAEIEGLILMREEEKLARDVYLTLGETWDLNIFFNIAESEQTHTDAVKDLLDRYGIEDPVKDDTVGVFTSPVMKDLYDALVAQGETSLVDALIVGATVEDLDIYDLSELLDETDNPDIIVVYENLSKGSRNHLRAFVSQIESRDGIYEPQYISQEVYDEILSSSQERGTIG
ncbi:MAG: DUF2202 domain-containing protein [Candidatus Bathyarchaeota archaeon]|nr:DUF2202 domain-containing protein [Candidatus Bathyarchaeota archaeon]